MFKKFTFWALIICFLVAVSMMFGTETKNYKIETWEPDHILCVELVMREVPIRARIEDLGKYTSSVEIFKEAIKEVSREYYIYSSCPIVEAGYPSVFGSWTKALILFVEPKNNRK